MYLRRWPRHRPTLVIWQGNRKVPRQAKSTAEKTIDIMAWARFSQGISTLNICLMVKMQPGMTTLLSLVRVLRILWHFTACSRHHLRLELFCHLEERRLFYQLSWTLTIKSITWRCWGGRAGTHSLLPNTLTVLFVSVDMNVTYWHDVL